MHEAGFDGADRHVERSRDLRDAEFLSVIKGNRRTLFRWQRGHGAGDLGGTRRCLRTRLAIDEGLTLRGHDLAGLAQALPLADQARSLARYNPIGPGREGSAITQTPQTTNNIEPGVLQHILGGIRLAHQAISVTQKVGVPEPRQAIKGASVARSGGSHEILA